MHTNINRPTIYKYLCLMMLFLYACKKDDLADQSRLFRPVAKGDMKADGNWISATWQSITGAVGYEAQVSRDTFRTVDVTVQIDKSTVTIENLKWNQLYQVRVRALAEDTTLNSKMSDLGGIKTAKFPTILKTPAISDITDVAVRVSWTNSGATVTTIKILKASDSSVAKQVSLTDLDVTNQSKVVDGLNPATAYIIFLYSGTSVRGWENFSTKTPFAGTVIDLRSITGVPSILQDTLPDIPSGSVVVLKRGATYQMTTSYPIAKTVTILSGDDLSISDPATIFFATTSAGTGNNFDVAAGSVIDSIVFSNVNFSSDDATLANKYVMNIGQSCTVGNIVFESCKASTFRGFLRTKDKTMTISSVSINNCIISDLGNYGLITIDNAANKVDKISVRNSTIFRVGTSVIKNTKSSLTSSVTVENCTVNEAPLANSFLVEFTGMDVSGGILIRNCIFGIGKASSGNTAVKGARAGAATTITGANNYSTSDYTLTATSGFPIPATTAYSGASTALFTDPATGNFKIKDNTFAGKSTAGDPRWRP